MDLSLYHGLIMLEHVNRDENFYVSKIMYVFASFSNETLWAWMIFSKWEMTFIYMVHTCMFLSKIVTLTEKNLI